MIYSQFSILFLFSLFATICDAFYITPSSPRAPVSLHMALDDPLLLRAARGEVSDMNLYFLLFFFVITLCGFVLCLSGCGASARLDDETGRTTYAGPLYLLTLAKASFLHLTEPFFILSIFLSRYIEICARNIRPFVSEARTPRLQLKSVCSHGEPMEQMGSSSSQIY